MESAGKGLKPEEIEKLVGALGTDEFDVAMATIEAEYAPRVDEEEEIGEDKMEEEVLPSRTDKDMGTKEADASSGATEDLISQGVDWKDHFEVLGKEGAEIHKDVHGGEKEGDLNVGEGGEDKGDAVGSRDDEESLSDGIDDRRDGQPFSTMVPMSRFKYREEEVEKERVKPKSLSEFFEVIATNDGENGRIVIREVVGAVLNMALGVKNEGEMEKKMKKLSKTGRAKITLGRLVADDMINQAMDTFESFASEYRSNLQEKTTDEQGKLFKERVGDLMVVWGEHESKGRAGVRDLLGEALERYPTGAQATVRREMVDKIPGKIDADKLLGKLRSLLSE
jgi:hypothetical protein